MGRDYDYDYEYDYEENPMKSSLELGLGACRALDESRELFRLGHVWNSYNSSLVRVFYRAALRIRNRPRVGISLKELTQPIVSQPRTDLKKQV